MNEINIAVINRVASQTTGGKIICGNDDYIINFTFDEEWDAYPYKTARFQFLDGAGVKYIDVPFEGTRCNAPILSGIDKVKIGVYAGDLTTTTGTTVMCLKSILCDGGNHKDPDDNTYNEVMEMFNTKILEPNAVVRQKFDPESEDAMSGKAIDEVLKEQAISIEVEPFVTEEEWVEEEAPSYGEEPVAYTMSRSASGVTVKNYVVNGNFATADNWSVVSGGTLTIVDGKASVYNDGSTGSVNGIKQSIDAGERGFVVGDKWFVKVNMSVETYTTDNGVSMMPNHQVYINVGNFQFAFDSGLAVKGESFENVDKYGILIANSKVAKADLYARVQYSKPEFATGKTTVFKNIVAVNLTEVYGAGNEPDKADDFYALLSTLEDAYFDGTTTLYEDTGDSGDNGNTGDGGDDSGDDSGGDNTGGDDGGNDDGGNDNTDIISGTGYKLTITTAEKTETLYLYQGQKGEDGADGKDGVDGKDGADGISPTITAEEIEGGNRLTITDKNGEQTVDLMNAPSTDAELREVTDALGETTFLEDLTDTLTIETGGLNASTGVITYATTLADARATLPFKVEVGEVYHVWGAINTSYCLIALYDEDKKFIKPIGIGTQATATRVENEIFVVPEKATDKDGNERKVEYMACGTKQIARASEISGMDLSIKREKTKYNNTKETVSNAVTDVSVEKLDKVLCSPNGAEWVLTITNDGVIKAVKRRNTGGDIVTTLTLPTDLPVGTYALRYENAQGTLTDHADVCSVEVATEGEVVVYNGLIAENVAPSNATSIGVYNNASGSKVGSIELGFLQNDYPEKLYSFGAISDIHIGQSDSVEDFTNAVDYFEKNNDVEFVTICGDMVDKGNDATQLQKYNEIVKKAKKPIYVAMGNHEANHWESFDAIRGYFAQEKFPNINQDLYFSFTHKNDVFIMLGTNGVPGYNATFSLEELKWLYETLETNRNRRCFLYTHYYPIDGSGDPLGLYNGNGFNNLYGRAFLGMLKHYKNVIYFHGHTHTAFEVQEYHPMNTIDKIYGRYSVHIPSLTWPRIPFADMSEYDKKGAEGQGYIVDVYENGIALRGRDFEKGAYSPIGSYYLDTVIQKIEANTYCDETGVIATPIL